MSSAAVLTVLIGPNFETPVRRDSTTVPDRTKIERSFLFAPLSVSVICIGLDRTVSGWIEISSGVLRHTRHADL
jgi:hypothetical protein